MPPSGAIIDRLTQRWVKVTGRRSERHAAQWLDGPAGEPEGIGGDCFERWADREGLVIRRPGTSPLGLLPSFAELAGPTFRPEDVHHDVRRFYEETSAYELEAWSEWCGAYRPFGWLLARIFSRRLQQLNVPLNPLDTSHGTDSQVIHLVEPDSGRVTLAAWVRHLKRSGDVLYAGSYSVTRPPGYPGPCIRVVFPLPNGNATVILKPVTNPDRSLTVWSQGRGFGEPGFYFTVHGQGGNVWARYVKTMRESIKVYPSGDGDVRADHVMWIFGSVFLRLHYRMRRRHGRRQADSA